MSLCFAENSKLFVGIALIFVQMLAKFKGSLNYIKMRTNAVLFSNPKCRHKNSPKQQLYGEREIYLHETQRCCKDSDLHFW